MNRYTSRPRRGIPTRRLRINWEYVAIAIIVICICIVGNADFKDAVIMAGGK